MSVVSHHYKGARSRMLQYSLRLSCRIGCFILVLVLGMRSILASAQSLEANPGEIKAGSTLGVILPLSGDYAPFGEKVRKGIELYLSRNPSHLKVAFEDGGTMNPQQSVSAMRKLVDVNRVDVVSVMVVDDAEPLAKLMERKRLPLVTLWDGNRRVLDLGKTTFSVGYMNEVTAGVLAEHALRDGRKDVAVVSEAGPWSELVAREFSTKIKLAGGKLLSSESIATNTTDFSSLITKLKKQSPQAVLLALNLPGSIATFLRQSKNQKFNPVFLTGEAFVGDGVKIAGQAAEGVLVVWAAPNSASAEEGGDSVDPIEAGAISVGFDGMAAIEAALKTPGASTIERFLNYLGSDHSLERKIATFKIMNGTMHRLD
jgi:branched-chain amino acid transport system substrate-binding protein